MISAPETCTDSIKNQDETDVDCGGNICPKCGNTRTCTTDIDCISGFCNSDRICSSKWLMNANVDDYVHPRFNFDFH